MRLTAAIRQYETDNSVTVLGPARWAHRAAISLDVVTGKHGRHRRRGPGVTRATWGSQGTTFNDTTPAEART